MSHLEISINAQNFEEQIFYDGLARTIMKNNGLQLIRHEYHCIYFFSKRNGLVCFYISLRQLT